MASLNRRSFLKYVGAGVVGTAAAHLLGPLARGKVEAAGVAAGTWVNADGSPAWAAVPYPVPLPGDAGSAAEDAARLASYEVRDTLVVPDGFKFDVVAGWGDAFGPPDRRVRFGQNCDYTGLVPIAGKPGEFWLVVNHEYISGRPWLQGYEKLFGRTLPTVRLTRDENHESGRMLVGAKLQAGNQLDISDGTDAHDDDARAICAAALEELGVCVLHVRSKSGGGIEVIADAADHKRFCGQSSQNADAEDAMTIVGPAASILGARSRGTFANCSGATTPWGTVLTCEENFQEQVPEFIDASGQPAAGFKLPFSGEGTHEKIDLPFEF